MSNSIEAIYEDGVLKPLKPLALPERTRVKVIVSASASIEQAHQDAAADLAANKREVAEALARSGGVSTAEMLSRAAAAARSQTGNP